MIHCWFCDRNILSWYSADINLCWGCHLFMQRIITQEWRASRWRKIELKIARKAYVLAMRLSRHKDWDSDRYKPEYVAPMVHA